MIIKVSIVVKDTERKNSQDRRKKSGESERWEVKEDDKEEEKEEEKEEG